MQTEIMLALQSCLKKDYSEKNQLRQIDIIRIMLEINQDVIGHGISRLEDYQSHYMSYPMLSKGLKLVRDGREPQVIETILLNTAIANDVDLLESLLIIEGVISIQLLFSPDVTRELLLSYFSFDMQDILRKSLNDLKLNFIEPLDMKEIEKILISNTLNINSSVNAIEKWSNIDKEIVANEFILHDLWKKQKNSVENKMI